MSEKLKQFIEDARSKGMSDDALRDTLFGNGWDKNLVIRTMYGVDIPNPDTELENQID